MVNVLQYVIYMNEWNLNWPSNASIAIKTIRTIALGEFINTKKIKKIIFKYYGFDMHVPL